MNERTTKRGAGLLALAVTVALGAGATAAAQGAFPGGPGAGHGIFLRALRGGLATLALTDDQKAQIRTILSSKRDAGQALRQKMRTDAQALHALAAAPDVDPAAVGAAYLKVRANREASRSMAAGVVADVKAVLTPEQQTKLDGYLAALRQLRRHPFGGASR
jgi:Spy/CpxP family protein refolding chaperone